MTEDQIKADALYLRNHCNAMLPLEKSEVEKMFSSMRAVHGLHSVRTLICMSHERLRNELSGAMILIDDYEQEIASLKERLKGGVLA